MVLGNTIVFEDAPHAMRFEYDQQARLINGIYLYRIRNCCCWTDLNSKSETGAMTLVRVFKTIKEAKAWFTEKKNAQSVSS